MSPERFMPLFLNPLRSWPIMVQGDSLLKGTSSFTGEQHRATRSFCLQDWEGPGGMRVRVRELRDPREGQKRGP